MHNHNHTSTLQNHNYNYNVKTTTSNYNQPSTPRLELELLQATGCSIINESTTDENVNPEVVKSTACIVDFTISGFTFSSAVLSFIMLQGMYVHMYFEVPSLDCD